MSEYVSKVIAWQWHNSKLHRPDDMYMRDFLCKY